MSEALNQGLARVDAIMACHLPQLVEERGVLGVALDALEEGAVLAGLVLANNVLVVADVAVDDGRVLTRGICDMDTNSPGY